MNAAVLDFVRRRLSAKEVAGKRVLEVGSMDVNGCPRAIVQTLGPSEYCGVDIQKGRNVDRVVDASALVAQFGPESFDVVISTEMVEHLVDWRGAFSQMKRVLRPQGTMIVTTRSPGFKYHPYPIDCWRYRPEDMKRIFGDMADVVIEADPEAPGIFVKATKPMKFVEIDLKGLELPPARPR
jgi:SAM-dependent methyltransferase